MTQFEKMYPHEVQGRKIKCPGCKKTGKSIRGRENVDGKMTYCCGNCGETWKNDN